MAFFWRGRLHLLCNQLLTLRRIYHLEDFEYLCLEYVPCLQRSPLTCLFGSSLKLHISLASTWDDSLNKGQLTAILSGGGGQTCPSITQHPLRTSWSLTVTSRVQWEWPKSGGNLSQGWHWRHSLPGSACRESPRPAPPAAACCRPSWCRWSSARRLGWFDLARPRSCEAGEPLASSDEAIGRARHSHRSKTRSCLAEPFHLKKRSGLIFSLVEPSFWSDMTFSVQPLVWQMIDCLLQRRIYYSCSVQMCFIKVKGFLNNSSVTSFVSILWESLWRCWFPVYPLNNNQM